MRLEGKVVVVTGSTMGIGAAIARRAVAEGARVLVHGLERDLGEQVVRSLGAGAAALHVDDLSDPEAPSRIVGAALSSFGRIDALVNNAARVRRSTIESTDARTFDAVMAVNARAPLLLIRAALDELERRRGAVLNIGSVNAHCGEPTLLAYSASKGALMTLTRNLGDTLHRERGVRVNQVNPEWVLTEGERRVQEAQGNPPDWHERLPKEWAPSGRLILPDEIASAVIYWIGDESRPISGSVVDLGQFPVIGRNPAKVIR
jgi:NAD(P)-dependent dehydrogenase (short-subunit alcohol dehydrogenase family)